MAMAHSGQVEQCGIEIRHGGWGADEPSFLAGDAEAERYMHQGLVQESTMMGGQTWRLGQTFAMIRGQHDDGLFRQP